MKTVLKSLILLMLMGTYSSFSQSSDDEVKKEVVKLLNQFQNELDVIGNANSSTDAVKKSKAKVKKLFSSSKDFIVQDYDTTKRYPAKITINDYIDGYSEAFPIGVKPKFYFKKAVGSGVYVDKERNSFTYKFTVKIAQLFEKEVTKIKDSISVDTVFAQQETDSLARTIERIDSTVTQISIIDTVKAKKSKYVDFYVHFILQDGKYQNYSIVASSVKKKKPKYRELDELTKWWVSLDEEWRKRISKELKFPKVPSPYWLKLVGGMQRLDLTGAQMATYEPLLKFKGVRQLKLKNSNIDTLIYLQNMSLLTAINLNGTKINSLHGLNPKSLEFLFCKDLGLTDIDALTGSTNLIELDFSGNDVVDLSPIRLNGKLEELYFNANEVIDLAPISRLTSLEKLHCGKNKEITSLAPLKGMYNLVELDVFNTGIASLKDIVGLRKITRLDISFTKIKSLLPMRHLKYLTYLAFSGNHLDNYGVLDGFVYLKTLKCAQTNVSDIGPVNRMKGLLVLYAPHTDFSKNDIQRFKKNHPKCQITYY